MPDQNDDEDEIIHLPIGDPIEGKTIPLHVKSDEDLEDCQLVLCVKAADDPGYFTDNVHANCAGCGVEVIHRPYMPVKPLKMCFDCAMGMMEKQ